MRKLGKVDARIEKKMLKAEKKGKPKKVSSDDAFDRKSWLEKILDRLAQMKGLQLKNEAHVRKTFGAVFEQTLAIRDAKAVHGATRELLATLIARAESRSEKFRRWKQQCLDFGVSPDMITEKASSDLFTEQAIAVWEQRVKERQELLGSVVEKRKDASPRRQQRVVLTDIRGW